MDVIEEGRTIAQDMNADQGMVALLNKSEIDQQITTAKRYPRSLKLFRDQALEMVTLHESIAQECIYALPRDGKVIEGPSARFAEIIAHAWRNNRAGSRVVDDSGDFVISQGVFHDLENNVAITYEVQRRIIDKYGKRYKPDMIGVTANAASSIALRNAVLKGVPKAFWSAIYQAARKTIMGDFKTLANRRSEAIQQFIAYGVTEAMLFEKLGVSGKEDIGLEQLVILSGLLTALRDGDTTVEDAFTKSAASVEMPKAKTQPKPPAETSTQAQEQPQQKANEPAAPPAQPAQSDPPTESATGPADAAATETKPLGKPMPEQPKKILRAKMAGAGKTEADIEAQFGKAFDSLTLADFNAVSKWLSGE